ILGARLLVSVFGLPNVMTLGTLDVALSACVSLPTGFVQYSYRSPRFNVSRVVNFRSSWKYPAERLCVPRKLPLPAPRNVRPGTEARLSFTRSCAVLYQ